MKDDKFITSEAAGILFKEQSQYQQKDIDAQFALVISKMNHRFNFSFAVCATQLSEYPFSAMHRP